MNENTDAVKSLIMAEEMDLAAKDKNMTLTAEGNLLKENGKKATLEEENAVKLSALALVAKSSITKVLAGDITLVAAVQKVWNAAMEANPIGTIITAVTACIAVVTALYKVFNKDTEETKKLKAENERLAESHTKLSKAVEESKSAYRNNSVEIDAQATSSTRLTEKVTDLQEKITKLKAAGEDYSTEQQQLISYTKMLGDSTDGLSVEYDALTNTLNLNEEQINAQIHAMSEREKLQNSQSGYTDLLTEQAKIEQELKEIDEQRLAIGEDISFWDFKRKDMLKDLDKTEKEYKETLEETKNALSELEEVMDESLSKMTTEGQNLIKELDDLDQASLNLTESVDKSSDAYKDNIRSIENETKANSSLLQKVQELASKENLSAGEKALMKSQIDQLNDSIEGLNLAYSEEEAALNMSRDAIEEKIEAYKGQENIAAGQEYINEILQNQAEIESQINDVRSERETWEEMLASDKVHQEEYDEAIARIEEKEKSLQATHSDLNTTYDEVAVSMMENASLLSDGVIASIESQIMAYDNLTTHQQSTLDNITNTFQGLTGNLSDITNSLEENTELTYDSLKSNWENIKSMTEDHTELYGDLIKKGLSESFLEALGANETEALPLLRELNGKSLEELEEWQKEWEGTYDTAASNVINAFELDEETAAAIKSFVTDGIGGSLLASVEEADFASLGKGTMSNYFDGVEASAEETTNSVAEKFDGMCSTVGETVEAQSESYKAMGTETMDSYVQGMEEEMSGCIENIPVLLNPLFGSVSGVLKDNASIISKDMSDGLLSGMSELPKMTEKPLSEILTNVEVFSNKSQESFASGMNQINTDTVVQFAALNATSMNGMQTYSDNISNIASAIPAMFSMHLTYILDSVESWKTNLADKGRAAMANFKNIIEENANSISLYTAGQNVVVGMWQGMQSKKEYFYSNVYNFFSSMVTKAKNALQIESPSKVMMKLGGFTVEGFMKGLTNMESHLDQLVEDLFSPDLSDLTVNTITTGSQVLAAAAEGVGSNVYHFTQNLQSVAQTPYENAQYAQAMLRKARWK